MAAGSLIAMWKPHLMRRVLLTTTAVLACMMLAPPVEARPAPRHVGTGGGFDAVERLTWS